MLKKSLSVAVEEGNYNENIEGNYYDQKTITNIKGDYINYINKNFRSGNLLAVMVAISPFLIFSVFGGGLGVILARKQIGNEILALETNISNLEINLNEQELSLTEQKNTINKQVNLIQEQKQEIERLEGEIDELINPPITITQGGERKKVGKIV